MAGHLRTLEETIRTISTKTVQILPQILTPSVPQSKCEKYYKKVSQILKQTGVLAI
jgi:hypothetical protein